MTFAFHQHPATSISNILIDHAGQFNMASGLQDLPLEVFEVLCEYTDFTAELKTLRLVNRELHVKCARVFSHRQFQEIKTSLRRSDLEKLVNISAHPAFSTQVHTVVVWPKYFKPKFSAEHHMSMMKGAQSNSQIAVLPESEATSYHHNA